MNLEHLLSNEQARRHEFPIVGNSIYLAHSSSGPLPRRVAQRVRWYADHYSQSNQVEPGTWERYNKVRHQVAKLIHGHDDQIAFVAPTSLSLGVIAESLDFQEGDRILLQQFDFPANITPWRHLERKGVVIDFVPYPENGRLTWECIEPHLWPETKLVAVSGVHYQTGHRPGLARIHGELKRREILLSVDAIQALGVVPLSVKEADFIVTGGQKWLLSPLGSGFMWVRRSILEQMHPTPMGWLSVTNPDNHLYPSTELSPDATRFELGTPNVLGTLALGASLELFHEIGLEAIYARIAKLHRMVRDEAAALGLEVVGHDDAAETSGIASVRVPDRDAEHLVARLANADVGGRNVVITARPEPQGGPCLRFAPHFYTTEEEVRMAFEVLRELL